MVEATAQIKCQVQIHLGFDSDWIVLIRHSYTQEENWWLRNSVGENIYGEIKKQTT